MTTNYEYEHGDRVYYYTSAEGDSWLAGTVEWHWVEQGVVAIEGDNGHRVLKNVDDVQQTNPCEFVEPGQLEECGNESLPDEYVCADHARAASSWLS